MNAIRIAAYTLIAVSTVACSATRTKQPDSAQPAPVVPAVANVDGNWKIATQTPIGPVHGTMTNNQKGGEFSGKLVTDHGNAEYTGMITGNQMKFGYLTSVGIRFEYTGDVEGDTINGKAVFGGNSEGTWIATRVK